jgi:hypothetical protein
MAATTYRRRQHAIKVSTWLSGSSYPDDSIEIKGRLDCQVKIRGHRVEPSEIEQTLARLPGVSHAAVIAKDTLYGGKKLIGCFVEHYTVDASQLRSFLAAHLPAYMCPRLIRVDAMPTTPSGKIDRLALANGASVQSCSFRPRPTALDRCAALVTQAIFDLTELAEVDLDAGFDDLGITSLLYVELIEYPTPRALASHLTDIYGTD